ncbi:unnamed protein product [Gongylonema pulchrum]|uniref:Secreted protein n=1 Tax=Gongylonema pulchrum TaxID=637853 RepID=A0A183EX78_9BILA|nr:unnamed protein product [Gongylonema pulchrum]
MSSTLGQVSLLAVRSHQLIVILSYALLTFLEFCKCSSGGGDFIYPDSMNCVADDELSFQPGDPPQTVSSVTTSPSSEPLQSIVEESVPKSVSGSDGTTAPG